VATVQPSGTVTLVFTDIEGSTRLLDTLGTDEYRRELDEHRRAVRGAFERHDGYEVDSAGDGFFFAFATAADAVQAVGEALVGGTAFGCSRSRAPAGPGRRVSRSRPRQRRRTASKTGSGGCRSQPCATRRSC
jgi:class 3 adenylate cyclase